MNDDANGAGVLPAMIDFDAEQDVLAGFILDPDLRRRMADELGIDAFADPGHGRVWKMLADMHATGGDIDPAIVRREARRLKVDVPDDDLIAIVGRHGSDARAALERLKGCRRRRWLWTQADALRRAAENADADPLMVAVNTVDRIGEMIRRATASATRGGGAAELRQRFDDIGTGRIANLDWPEAPVLTRMARPLESGSITMLSGAPGDGKTFWLLQSLIGWIEQGVRPSICMLEKPRAWHLHRCIALLERNPGLTKNEWMRANPTITRDAFARNEPILERLGECISEGRKVGETLADIGRWIDAEADEHDVVIVDPVSLADAGEKRWLADGSFIRGCIRTVERTNARVVLVTHPNASSGPPSLSSLMGGSTYQRATDSVLHFTKLDRPKRFDVARVMAGQPITARVTCNRTMSVFKGRNGSAGGKRFAFDFDDKTLAFIEQGIIVGEVKDDADAEDDGATSTERAA